MSAHSFRIVIGERGAIDPETGITMDGRPLLMVHSIAFEASRDRPDFASITLKMYASRIEVETLRAELSEVESTTSVYRGDHHEAKAIYRVSSHG